MYTSRIKLRIAISLFIYMSIFAISIFYSRLPGGKPINTWIINGKKVSFPLRGRLDRPTWLKYDAQIYSHYDTKIFLFLSRFDSKGIVINLNGKEIFSIGKWDNANIWTHTFAVPLHLKKGENIIEMNLKFLFDYRSIYAPYIVKNPWPILPILNLLFSGLPTFASFYLFSFFIYSIVLAIRVKKIRNKYLIIGFSLLFTAIFLSNMGFWYSLGPGKLIFLYKRIVYASIYLALAFYQEAISLLTGKVVKHRFIRPLSIIIAAIILIIPDFRVARNFALLYASPFFIFLLALIDYRIIKYKLNKLIPSSIVLTISFVHFYLTNAFSYIAVPLIVYGLSYYSFSIVNFLREEYESLYVKSEIDPLTGAYNRRVLESLLVSEMDMLIYFDVDNFKAINDSFGHSFGDDVLKNLVTIMRNSIKGKDTIIRLGGDEFIIILKNCSKQDVCEIAKEIAYDFKKSMNFGVSYGIVSLKEGLDKALKIADEGMYKAKYKKKRSIYEKEFA